MASHKGSAFNQGTHDTQAAGSPDYNPYDRDRQPPLWQAYEQGRIEGMRELAQLGFSADEPLPGTRGYPMHDTACPDWLLDAEDIADTRRYLEQAMDRLVSSAHCSRQEAQEWIQQMARANKATLRQVAEAVIAQQTVSYHYDVPI